MRLLEEFEEHLRKRLFRIETFHPFYEEALNYMLQAKAKRFRPLLLLSIVEAKEPLLIPAAMDAAVALEMFHTYSLIHDDLPVMDNADLRRGRESLHKKFDEVTAVLVGDALNTHAFYLLSKVPLSGDTRTRLVEILSQNGGAYGMVHGQALDCHFEKKPLNLQELIELHNNKTGKLIAAALMMGAVIVELEQKVQEELYRFGLDLGLLFQIQDDLLDAYASTEQSGKTTQNDSDKNSFANLLGVKAFEEADKLASTLEAKLESFDEDIQTRLQPLLNNYLYRHNHFKRK